MYRWNRSVPMVWPKGVWWRKGPRVVVTRRALVGIPIAMVADSDSSRLGLLLRSEQARAHSQVLREQLAALAEAVVQVELDVARGHEAIAERGGSLAAQAREHAKRAREFAASDMPRRSACAGSGG